MVFTLCIILHSVPLYVTVACYIVLIQCFNRLVDLALKMKATNGLFVIYYLGGAISVYYLVQD